MHIVFLNQCITEGFKKNPYQCKYSLTHPWTVGGDGGSFAVDYEAVPAAGDSVGVVQGPPALRCSCTLPQGRH